jgi:hypothetical protein
MPGTPTDTIAVGRRLFVEVFHGDTIKHDPKFLFDPQELVKDKILPFHMNLLKMMSMNRITVIRDVLEIRKKRLFQVRVATGIYYGRTSGRIMQYAPFTLAFSQPGLN